MTQNKLNSSSPVIQIVSTSLSTVLDCSTPIPRDNTIPQNTEGTQVFTLAITPQLSTSKLRIFFSGFGTVDAIDVSASVALFQDTTADALSAKSVRTNSARGCTLDLDYVMTSATTSSTTFKIRVGGQTTSQHFYINGNSSGTQLMGGVASTTMTIVEYRA